jgi:alpha-methylacyl-CoA racemase
MRDGGTLAGVSVVEFEAIGPVPFMCSLLSDLGATVTKIVRPQEAKSALPANLAHMGQGSGSTVELDLKQTEDVEAALSLIASADVLVEGLRPGTMERLGLGPAVVCERSPGLVYTRVTGWGQEGPYASMAGHDINYIGLTGALYAIGPEDGPIPPLNLLGDYAGGALYAVIGILAALTERSRTGMGRVIDAAMVDGTSALLAPIRTMQQIGVWTDERQANLLDGGAPFYRTYRTADDEFVAVGALEPRFFDALLLGLGIAASSIPDRLDPRSWPETTSTFETVFATRTQAEWQQVFDGTDACVTPVLRMSEMHRHPHNAQRKALVTVDGVDRPASAPRFSSHGEYS